MTGRDRFCYCIPLRLAVFVIAVIELLIAGATTYQKYKASDTDSTTAKIIIYVALGIQVLIGILGIISVITKRLGVIRLFHSLWWGLTIAITALNIVSLVFIITSDKQAVKDQCAANATLNSDTSVATQADDCYKAVVIVSAVVLVVQFLILAGCGFIIGRFKTQVINDQVEASEQKSAADAA